MPNAVGKKHGANRLIQLKVATSLQIVRNAFAKRNEVSTIK